MVKNHEIVKYFLPNVHDLNLMSCTAITLKIQYVLAGFQTKDAVELESCKQDINLVPLMLDEDKTLVSYSSFGFENLMMSLAHTL